MELLMLLLPRGHVIELVVDLMNGGGDVVQPGDGLTVGSIVFPAHRAEGAGDDGGQDEDGTFRVVVEDRGADYPYRYTLLMAWDDSHGNEGCGQVSHSIPGWPHGWPGRYFRTPRELRGAMHSAAYDASWVMEVRS
jgi:hypothetical protein